MTKKGAFPTENEIGWWVESETSCSFKPPLAQLKYHSRLNPFWIRSFLAFLPFFISNSNQKHSKMRAFVLVPPVVIRRKMGVAFRRHWERIEYLPRLLSRCFKDTLGTRLTYDNLQGFMIKLLEWPLNKK
ncbi:hypothetical protein BLX87_05125 [Bacillus sp. VT-16-64]|nr:hypothetical protein BLX87_05125 [Bacillus sp. VT-16-64]